MSAVVKPVESSSCDEHARRIAEAMQRQLGVFCGLLDDPNVIEVMLNADGRVRLDGLPANPVESAGAELSRRYERDRTMARIRTKSSHIATSRLTGGGFGPNRVCTKPC